MTKPPLRWIGEVRWAESAETWGLIPGIYEGCALIRLPVAFQAGRDLAPPPLLALPRRLPFRLPHPQRLAFFDAEGVWLLPTAG